MIKITYAIRTISDTRIKKIKTTFCPKHCWSCRANHSNVYKVICSAIVKKTDNKKIRFQKLGAFLQTTFRTGLNITSTLKMYFNQI